MDWCSRLLALAALCSLAAGDVASKFRRLQDSCMPWLEPLVPRLGNCGHGKPAPCNITWLAERCLSTPGCNAFNSNGFLKQCPGGRCGCDADKSACICTANLCTEDHGCEGTDLYVPADRAAPKAWVDGIHRADMLFASPEPNVCYMPSIGNGYLATVVSWGALYVGGLFNGRCGTTHKARLPSSAAVQLEGAELLGSALDLRRAVFLRRYKVGEAEVELRYFAHRARRHLLVVEAELLTSGCETVSMSSLWDGTASGKQDLGTGCAGSFSVDFSVLEPTAIPGANATAYDLQTTDEGDAGELFNVTMVMDMIPSSLELCAGVPAVFVTSVVTSIDNDSPETREDTHQRAVDEFQSAQKAELFAEHAAAWEALHSTFGIDVGFDPALPDQGLDLARHVNASKYNVLNTIREDHPVGVSPGGLATANYNGAIFFDMDWWVEPAMVFLQPSLAAAMLEYRFRSLQTTKDIAHTFGYKGSMFAWTSAYLGRPFGCCDGQGGLENCLEQHITPDVAFSAAQFFRATQNRTWLKSRGMPIMEGVAEWLISRVTPSGNGNYSIRGVLPVDEWSVDSGCGSENPGVDDDAQMNGASIGALRGAADAAELLGRAADAARWREVASSLTLLWNETGHHNQFTSATCPGGWGGSHYTGRHTVCPTDVEHLTYPLRDALGERVSEESLRADAELFLPLTCHENAGMTEPMHTIVRLEFGDEAGAQDDLRRAMHGACYGPFVVRNEVDKHADQLGAQFDNTHFVTGDGGMLQSMLNGYGGLRITPEADGASLKMLRPTLPTGASSLTLRVALYEVYRTIIDLSNKTAAFTVQSGPGDLCLIDARQGELRATKGQTLKLDRAAFAWPARIKPCDEHVEI